MKFSLPDRVEYILSRLESQGYRADIVGGSVRDLLLGKSPDDYDITTSATPEQTKAVFSNLRTVDTGIKHGTVSLILDGRPYEITTYRVDGEYKDSRHPEQVFFTQRIEDDLARRDFTVNAIAYSPRHGITDPFGGRADLDERIIRAVGDPELRFSEDALRILRGMRFSAVLGFEIDENTASAIHEKKHLLKNVSAERIYVELKKMLSAEHAHGVLLKYADIIAEVIPALVTFNLPGEEKFGAADYLSRLLSVFYLSTANPASAFDCSCLDLHTDTHTREVGVAVLGSVDKYNLESDVGLSYLLRDLDVERATAFVKLQILLDKAEQASLSHLINLIESGVCYRHGDLAVNGRDILAIGARGRQVGEILDALLTSVIEGRVKNKKNALLSLAVSLVK